MMGSVCMVFNLVLKALGHGEHRKLDPTHRTDLSVAAERAVCWQGVPMSRDRALDTECRVNRCGLLSFPWESLPQESWKEPLWQAVVLVLNVNAWEGAGSGLFLKEPRCGKRPVTVARHLLQETDLKCDTFKEACCRMKQNGKPSDKV